ncbi:ty3-gypsy retrotransposon protein [Tanacetum coccineum]
MDEQAACRLLKDQTDAIYAKLHSQLAVLHVELQAIKSLGHNRHGEGGDAGTEIPKSMRLDVPTFNGSDPDSWIFSINEYFDLLETAADRRLKFVGFNLEGVVAKWFRWMSRNKLITDWEGFLESVCNRFGPCKYEDPQGALSKLLQTGHKFPGKFLLLMVDEDEDAVQDTPAGQDKALESGDISFLNSLDHQFYVKPSKYVFGVTTLEYLRHIISGQGVELDPKKATAIRVANNQDAATTNASSEGIGAMLLQNGQPISFFSRKLRLRMHVAATYQKELFAIMEAVYKWRQYLVRHRFTIRTDHKSIKELMQHVIQTHLQQKYVRKLMEEVTAASMSIIQPLIGLINDLRRENESLEELRHLHQCLDRGEHLVGFRREQGLLLYQGRYYIGVESKLKDLLLVEFHNTPSVGHDGTKKMLVGLSALFYWKGMRKSVEEFIWNCLVCQQTKYSTQVTGGLLQPLPTPTAVWEDVSMDFITGLLASKGLTVILVVVDRFSKYAHFDTLPTSFNAPKVVGLFMEIVVKHHGFPKTIVSDRDSIFMSKFWKQLFEASGTQLNHSTAYHPQTDG